MQSHVTHEGTTSLLEAQEPVDAITCGGAMIPTVCAPPPQFDSAQALPGGMLFPPRIVSGIQPATSVHLGHIFGAIQPHIQLQHEYPGEAFYVIADFHALTRMRDPLEIQEATLEVACAYLALGLDPNKAILYRQSDVPRVLELFWMLSCHAPIGELLRVPDPHDRANSRSAGHLTYPVLMAADILGLRGTVVPAGVDQTINLERVRDVAERFNHAYGVELFPVPRLRTPPYNTIRGTDRRKMAGVSRNAICPFDPYKKLLHAVQSIVTDSTPRGAPKNPNNCLVFQLYSLVAPPGAILRMRDAYLSGQMDYSEAKRDLAVALVEAFGESADLYHDYIRHSDWVRDILREGFTFASEQIDLTIDRVRQLLGLAA